MVRIDLKFRDRIAEMIGGELVNLCYQCGACVGDCPAARYCDDFNPRLIMLKTLLGLEDELVREDSIIWNCTNCFTCYERCPQKVRPIEVIIALKNMVYAKQMSPQAVDDIIKNVKATGRTVLVNETVQRRRKELGLEPLFDLPVDEIALLMDEQSEGENG